jgi:hypothetical protein
MVKNCIIRPRKWLIGIKNWQGSTIVISKTKKSQYINILLFSKWELSLWWQAKQRSPFLIVWWLDLHYLSPLTLWVRIPLGRYKLCDKVCQWLAAGRWCSPGTAVSFTNKTDRQILHFFPNHIHVLSIFFTIEIPWYTVKPG